MYQFKTIDYGLMNYEAVRNFHAVNKANLLSIEYRYTLSMIYPLQSAFNDFDVWRKAKKIIAECTWTIGYVTNVLNYFFDTDLKRIYITQKRITNIFVPNNNIESTLYAPNNSAESTTFAPNIQDIGSVLAETIIHVPASIYSDPIVMAQLVSVIEQIKITGLFYTIISI